MRSYLMTIGVFAAFALILAGSYKLFHASYVNNLEYKAHEAFIGGDYLASLAGYANLKDSTAPERVEVDTKILESKNLLVAEEVFALAERAKDAGDWFAVKALLEKGSATTNNSFKNYEQAAALYLEAANKVSDLEKKIETELAKFRKEAMEEKTRRKSAEEVVTEVKQEAAQVKQKLETTIREKDATTAELQVTTSQKNAAVQEAARERFLKFLNELELYTNMLTRANELLKDAVQEIEGGKGASGYIFLENGKPLLSQVETNAKELLNNRTEEQYKGEVKMLLQSAALFTEASRSSRNAIVFIEKENQDAEENFTRFLNEGKAAKQEALRILGITREFIAGSRL